jgi:hypothetical protein
MRPTGRMIYNRARCNYWFGGGETRWGCEQGFTKSLPKPSLR